jgi:hypothetical protein
MRLTSQDHLLDILEENYLKVVEENSEYYL